MPTRLTLCFPAAVFVAFVVLISVSIQGGDPAESRYFKDCETCPEMVVVPTGQFRQGDLTGAGDADEHPVRTVVFSRPFALSRHEITYALWDQCVLAEKCTSLSEADLPAETRSQHPVQNVSWLEAQEFVTWLSEISRQSYRLPTESEYEYAARAGATLRYSWGDTPQRQHSNYGAEECCGGAAEGFDLWSETGPVGSLTMNPFGLFDMAGNVQEWVADCWSEDYTNAPVNGAARVDGNCDLRVLRGGSWSSTPKMIRPANRDKGPIDVGLPYYGFRVARDL